MRVTFWIDTSHVQFHRALTSGRQFKKCYLSYCHSKSGLEWIPLFSFQNDFQWLFHDLHTSDGILKLRCAHCSYELNEWVLDGDIRPRGFGSFGTGSFRLAARSIDSISTSSDICFLSSVERLRGKFRILAQWSRFRDIFFIIPNHFLYMWNDRSGLDLNRKLSARRRLFRTNSEGRNNKGLQIKS
jgi:hypothetical protein